MTSLNRFEITREHFFPDLFAVSSLEIRQLGASAHRFAQFLWREIDGEAEETRAGWSNQQWQNYLADPRCEFYAVFCDGEPAGASELVREPTLMRDSGGKVRIKVFGLFPEYAGEGLGAAVLTRMVEKGFAAGGGVVQFQSKREIEGGILALLKRLHFKEV